MQQTRDRQVHGELDIEQPAHQFLGLDRIEGEGLLAHHMTAGVDRRGRQGCMGGRGAGDGHGIEAELECLGQRGARVRDAQSLHPPRRPDRVNADEDRHLEAGFA